LVQLFHESFVEHFPAGLFVVHDIETESAKLFRPGAVETGRDAEDPVAGFADSAHDQDVGGHALGDLFHLFDLKILDIVETGFFKLDFDVVHVQQNVIWLGGKNFVRQVADGEQVGDVAAGAVQRLQRQYCDLGGQFGFLNAFDLSFVAAASN